MIIFWAAIILIIFIVIHMIYTLIIGFFEDIKYKSKESKKSELDKKEEEYLRRYREINGSDPNRI